MSDGLMELDPAEWMRRELEKEAEQERESLRLIEQGLTAGCSFDAAMHAVTYGLADKVPPMLYRLWQEGAIDDEYLSDSVSNVWVHNKSPRRSLGERAWLRMFKATGFISATVDSRLIHADGTSAQVVAQFPLIREQPTAPVEGWRGASLESKGRGMSWTLYRDCAVQFAEAWAATTRIDCGVFRAIIPARAILAVFGDTREQEFVVNPNMLRGRVVLDETIPAPQRRAGLQRLFPKADD